MFARVSAVGIQCLQSRHKPNSPSTESSPGRAWGVGCVSVSFDVVLSILVFGWVRIGDGDVGLLRGWSYRSFSSGDGAELFEQFQFLKLALDLPDDIHGNALIGIGWFRVEHHREEVHDFHLCAEEFILSAECDDFVFC